MSIEPAIATEPATDDYPEDGTARERFDWAYRVQRGNGNEWPQFNHPRHTILCQARVCLLKRGNRDDLRYWALRRSLEAYRDNSTTRNYARSQPSARAFAWRYAWESRTRRENEPGRRLP